MGIQTPQARSGLASRGAFKSSPCRVGPSFADHLRSGPGRLPKELPHPAGKAGAPAKDGAEPSSAEAQSDAGLSTFVAEERPFPRPGRCWELDPMARALAHGMPVPTPGHEATAAPAAAPMPSGGGSPALEQVVEQLVRRIAWSGDARRGSARIELGSGRLAGAVLFISADGGSVDVSMQLPQGEDSQKWRDRIVRRLEHRGIHIGSLEVA
jgi:hypothetical protein